MYARRSVNIAENWALVADGGHGNDAPLADYAGRAGERGLCYSLAVSFWRPSIFMDFEVLFP